MTAEEQLRAALKALVEAAEIVKTRRLLSLIEAQAMEAAIAEAKRVLGEK